MKYFSVFTGAGGFEQGIPDDWECMGFSEIDKYCNMVLKYHYPNVVNYGNISKINVEQLPDFKLLVGGSPCQDVSVAGKRKGINAERSGLFFQYIKILKGKKPNYFIFENVEGLLSSNGGWDFARVLLEFSDAGYDIQYQILNAKYFGVPQNRGRIFIIGHRREASGKEIFFKQEYDTMDRKARIENRQIVPCLEATGYKGVSAERFYGVEGELDYLGAVMGKDNKKWLDDGKVNSRNFPQGQRVYSMDGISTTLASNAGRWGGKTGLYAVLTPARKEKRQNGRRIKDSEEPMFTLTQQDIHGLYDGMAIRRLIPLECERLMGWKDDWTKYGIDEQGKQIELSDTQRYRLCGNGVVSNVIKEITSKML